MLIYPINNNNIMPIKKLKNIKTKYRALVKAILLLCTLITIIVPFILIGFWLGCGYERRKYNELISKNINRERKHKNEGIHKLNY